MLSKKSNGSSKSRFSAVPTRQIDWELLEELEVVQILVHQWIETAARTFFDYGQNAIAAAADIKNPTVGGNRHIATDMIKQATPVAVVEFTEILLVLVQVILDLYSLNLIPLGPIHTRTKLRLAVGGCCKKKNTHRPTLYIGNVRVKGAVERN